MPATSERRAPNVPGVRSFARDTIGLFGALRAADVFALVVSVVLVPRFVPADELGGVLPLTSFATFLAMPLFAFAYLFMREANALAAEHRFGALKSLVRGVFVALAGFLALSVLVGAVTLPPYLKTLRLAHPAVGCLAVAAALAGCVAPVFMDALNGLRRFRAYGLVEIVSAAMRLAAFVVALPIGSLAALFVGNVVQPLTRMAGAALALRRELSVVAERYWSAVSVRRLARQYAGILAYLLAPMLAALVEQTVIRTHLPQETSAGYYLATRLSDLLNYLTLPLLFVLFPYAREQASRGRSHGPYVRLCCAVTLVAATLLSAVCALFGETLLSWLPHGGRHLDFAPCLPWLVLITALNALQTFWTNAEIAAGRFGFLIWFLPLHAIYAAGLPSLLGVLTRQGGMSSLAAMLTCFVALAAVKALALVCSETVVFTAKLRSI